MSSASALSLSFDCHSTAALAMSALTQEDQRQLIACQYSAWLPCFTQQTFRSHVIDLPDDFVEYLHEDGIVVGETSGAVRGLTPVKLGSKHQTTRTQCVSEQCAAAHCVIGLDVHHASAHGPAQLPRRAQPSASVVDEDEYQEWSDEDEGDSASDWRPRFPELHQAIASSIERLGGSVMPRLNWSTPTDALWISQNNSLLCTNADQVVLLLKSSDRVAHDLELLQRLAGSRRTPSSADASQPEAHTTAPTASTSGSAATGASSGPRAQLVLRRWQELRPEREFRCFVHDHALVGISQRDPSQFFPQLVSDADSLRATICSFHQEQVGSRFVLPSYAMDVYVTPAGAVKVVDINPIADTTSPLLFGWDELPYAAAIAARVPSGSTAVGGTPDEDEELQRRRQEHAADAMLHQANGANGHASNGSFEPDDGSSTMTDSDTGDDNDQVPMRIVEQASLVQPGQRMVCGMPFDMLNLQDSMDEMMQLMAQRQVEL